MAGFAPSSPYRMKKLPTFFSENQPREISSYLSGKGQKAGFIASDKPKNHTLTKERKRSNSEEKETRGSDKRKKLAMVAPLFSYINYF